MVKRRLEGHKLPVRQLAILAISRFAEPITLTSIFPYLPEMIESFGVPRASIAFWAGLTSAIFSFSQCLTAVPWGRLSDTYGRKPIILIGLTSTMLTSLLWGFSTSLPVAVVARALQGVMNGNVGIIRTMVAEMCPWRELQPRAFSVMPLVWNIGSVLGPAFGGALSNPYKRKPEDDRSSGPLLWRFPYALPNIVVAAFFLFGILTGYLFLDETLASKKGQRDYGRQLGIRLTVTAKSLPFWLKNTWLRTRGAETEPLLPGGQNYDRPEDDELQNGDQALQEEKRKAPGIREVLTKQTTLNLLVYTFLAMHSIAFDQLLPVFLHHPRTGDDASKMNPPFRFNRGFGLLSGRIGLLFTLYGVVGIFYQFVVFPPLARYYGVLNCLRAALVVMPVVYFFVPFTTLIEDVSTAEISLFALLLVKGLCTTFGFPCTTILLTNSASSIAVLATVNGLATSVSAVGRATGPVIAGSVFTWGVKEGFIVAPFWILSAIGAVGAAASWLLIEGPGFGDEASTDSPSEVGSTDEDEEYGNNKLSRNTDAAMPVPAFGVSEGVDDNSLQLAREWTRTSVASQAISETDEDLSIDSVIRGSHVRGQQTPWDDRRASGSASASAQDQQNGPRRRRSSVPIGMGSGFRRLSSNLGQSRSGYGSGGGLAG